MARIRRLIEAGELVSEPVGGNYMHVNKSLQVLQIGLIGEREETHYLKAGAGLADKSFRSVEILNTGGEAVFIDIFTGVGKYVSPVDDVSVTIDSEGGSLPVDIKNAILDVKVQGNTGVANAVSLVTDSDVVANTSVEVVAQNDENILVRLALIKDAPCRVSVGNVAIINAGDYLRYEGDFVEIKTSQSVSVIGLGATVVGAMSVVVLRRV